MREVALARLSPRGCELMILDGTLPEVIGHGKVNQANAVAMTCGAPGNGAEGRPERRLPKSKKLRVEEEP